MVNPGIIRSRNLQLIRRQQQISYDNFLAAPRVILNTKILHSSKESRHKSFIKSVTLIDREDFNWLKQLHHRVKNEEQGKRIIKDTNCRRQE